jgi:hypothetical protein
MGMRFSRKSPAVGSMKRHLPVESLMETEVKARVAVLSNGLASAAAEGLRTPPAPETEMTPVVELADTGSAEGAEVTTASAEEVAAELATKVCAGAPDVVSMNRVTVTIVVETQAAGAVVAATSGVVTAAAEVSTAA